jgi:hypothetical protein
MVAFVQQHFFNASEALNMRSCLCQGAEHTNLASSRHRQYARCVVPASTTIVGFPMRRTHDRIWVPCRTSYRLFATVSNIRSCVCHRVELTIVFWSRCRTHHRMFFTLSTIFSYFCHGIEHTLLFLSRCRTCDRMFNTVSSIRSYLITASNIRFYVCHGG